MTQDILLPLMIFGAALLYSSVGQAGGSGYLVAMAFAGVAPTVMKPSVLILNVLVAIVGTVRFYRTGCFSWPIFIPLVIGSVPLAFVGGVVTLPGAIFSRAVGAILIFAAARLLVLVPSKAVEAATPRTVAFPVVVVWGAIIGLLSGLTATGGGIFLMPLLSLKRWANTRESAALSVAFILVNSIAASIGHLAAIHTLPREIPVWALAAMAGGILGSELGSRRFDPSTVRQVLAVLLVIAGGKLLLA